MRETSIGHSSGYKWSIVRSSSSSLFQFSCISFEIEKVRQLSWLVSKVSTWAHTWSLTATIRQFRRIFLFQNSVTCLIRLNDCVIYSWNECQVHIVRSSSGIIFEEQCFIRRHVIYVIKKTRPYLIMTSLTIITQSVLSVRTWLSRFIEIRMMF